MPLRDIAGNPVAAIGAREVLSAYLASKCVAYLQGANPLAPMLGWPVVPDLAWWNAFGGAPFQTEDYLWEASAQGEEGICTQYRVDTLTVACLGGGTAVLTVGGGSVTCGTIGNGAITVAPYGSVVPNTTLGANAYVRTSLPIQLDFASGSLDPCGLLGGASQIDIPSLYIVTLRPPFRAGHMPDAAAEYAVAVAEWYPQDDIRGPLEAHGSAMPPSAWQWVTAANQTGAPEGVIYSRRTAGGF